ncbi:6-phosphogluconolactonase [Lewinellaceae bacterium SD302]|nr:6-phosphogluconolactonase [Lewinellaceae bacterium SD302]
MLTNKPGLGYAGTYTRKEPHVKGEAPGFYELTVDQNTGKLRIRNIVSGLINPSYLTVSSDGRNLYVVEELNDGRVVGFEIDQVSGPRKIGHWNTGSGATCHITSDQSDTYVAASNYLGGFVNLFRREVGGKLVEVQRIDLNPVEAKALKSHPHSTVFSPDNRYVFVPDLGLDRIWCFSFNELTSRFLPTEQVYLEVDTGSGPRHMTFHPKLPFAYLINEMSSSLIAMDYERESGRLSIRQTVRTVPADYGGRNDGADVHVHPGGKLIYASNRGHDSLYCARIKENGDLKTVGYLSTLGEEPRAFCISKDGHFLYVANQNTDNIVQFRINTTTGELEKIDELELLTPVCLSL